MNRKQNSDQPQYRMNYYPGGLTPAGYAIAASDKPGLYAASPYAAMPSPYQTAQPGMPPGMQQYAAARQQYVAVSQPSPYTSTQHAAAAYYATAAGYPGAVPLSSLQTISSSQQQSPYLSAGYPAGMGVQRVMGPSAAAGYGGSPLYAANTYTGLPTAMPAQQSRSPYAVAQVGYAASLPPSASSQGYPGASAYGPPY